MDKKLNVSEAVFLAKKAEALFERAARAWETGQNSGPCLLNAQVRVLPTGGDSNAILCWACFQREIAFRKERNRDLSKDCAFKLPPWTDLKVYGEEGNS